MSTDYDQNVTLLDLREQMIAGRFKLLRRMRHTTYSEVWIANNLAPKGGEPPTVAVKVLNLGLQGQLEPHKERILIENIRLEDYSLRTLRHPNIVRLFESGEDVDKRTGRQFYYLVLELLEGGDLYHLCHNQPLSLENALPFIAQLCTALTYAHQRGIIHRDIKPNNFLLTKDGRVLKALDFGTAHLLGKQNGMITNVGTDIYSAPESFSRTDGTLLSPATDVYSLAKVVLFMLTGVSPAPLAQKQITILRAAFSDTTWKESLLCALAKATADEPTERYQSVKDFHRALRQVLELTEVEIATKANHDQKRERPSYYFPPKHTRFEIPVPNNLAALPVNGFANLGVLNGFRRLRRDVCENIPSQLIVQVLSVVAIVVIVLVAASQILPWYKRGNVPVVTTQNTHDPLIGKEARAVTDVNIRFSASAQQPKIGLAENESRLRILSYSADRTWYEVQIIRHGRPKIDPSSSDRGWVRSKFLTLDKL
jgi:serine/threonine protein kinase